VTPLAGLLLALAAIPTGTPAGAARDRLATGAAPARESERATVERVLHDAIGWAQTKDRARLEAIVAHDESLFVYNPGALPPVVGWSRFVAGLEFWLDPLFVATRLDVRDLQVSFSRGGDVAWFSAVLDDCFAWDGTPGCWNDTRWTGVLERREGRWVIVQMHFSFAFDPPKPDPPHQSASAGG